VIQKNASGSCLGNDNGYTHDQSLNTVMKHAQDSNTCRVSRRGLGLYKQAAGPQCKDYSVPGGRKGCRRAQQQRGPQ